MFNSIETYFHNPVTYDKLERFISTYKPNELIIINNYEDNELNDEENKLVKTLGLLTAKPIIYAANLRVG